VLLSAGRPWVLNHLVTLALEIADCSDEEIAAIVTRIDTPALASLTITGQGVGAAGIQAILTAPNLSNLVGLNARLGKTPSHFLQTIARIPQAVRLQELVINTVWEPSELTAALSPVFNNLGLLDIWSGRLPPSDLEALRKKFGAKVRVY
jgi:hypothetical protein